MSGLDLSQFKHDIVAPTLQALATALAALNSPWAINQCAGTGLVESGLQYVEQLDNGPALGVCQMEPATHDDCWTNFLAYNPALAAVIEKIAGVQKPQAQIMVYNMEYAVAMARIKYWRSPLAAPAATDAVGCANYHKTVYNSSLGAADVAVNTPLFAQAIAA
jgi:hypothetical protein